MYVTRFAPTPSGPLHFGSLVTLTGAYLRARSMGGKFLIRIEDLDTPRCPAGMGDEILHEIELLGFDHDDDILWQSKNIRRYEDRLSELERKGLTFKCFCTRDELRHRPCTCYAKAQQEQYLNSDKGCSIRLNTNKLSATDKAFDDSLLGLVEIKDSGKSGEEFLTLKRRDGIISYNLACVIDDIDTGVTEVVRGQDLLEVTPSQLAMYKVFNAPYPRYLHLPLALENSDRKLSKQNHARKILEVCTPHEALRQALIFLGQDVSYITHALSCQDILKEAVDRFELKTISRSAKIAPKGSC